MAGEIFAICRPIPLLAPVTRATRFSDITTPFQSGVRVRAARTLRMSCYLVDGFSGSSAERAPPSRVRRCCHYERMEKTILPISSVSCSSHRVSGDQSVFTAAIGGFICHL